MSTRTQVIIDHRMDDYRNRGTTVAILQTSIPAALAVENYWRSVDPNPNENDRAISSWLPQREHTVVGYLDYLGPGNILIHVSEQVVVVSASPMEWFPYHRTASHYPSPCFSEYRSVSSRLTHGPASGCDGCGL
jgi:hypothetical protein